MYLFLKIYLKKKLLIIKNACKFIYMYILTMRAYPNIYKYIYHASLNYVFQRKKNKNTNFLHKLEKTHIGLTFILSNFSYEQKI
jgi:hypothetical protein